MTDPSQLAQRRPRFLETLWGRAALGLESLGLVLYVVLVIVSGPKAAEDVVFGVAMGALYLGAIAAGLALVEIRGERLAFLPARGIGWWALILGLFALSFVLGMPTGAPLAAYNLALLFLVVATVLAVVAVVRGETSVPVMVVGLLPVMFVLWFILGELATPH